MSTFGKKWVVAASIPVFALGASLASAHHSAAQFDFSKRITVQGTVERFEVKNPHAAAVIAVTDAKGTRTVEYEGHSASHFYRAGYTRDMVHAGDKIAILIAPRRDGADGGFIQAFTVNGKTVGFGGLSPETGKPAADGATAPSK